MLTINLEKKILAQNAKLVTPKQLLHISEFERIQKFIDDDSLKRVGITGSGNRGKAIKLEKEKAKQESLHFDQKNVFHITQIESIYNKYYLKFLPSAMFNGKIDEHLPYKINNFEAIYGVKCNSTEISGWISIKYTGNTFIIAPEESFILTEKPLDPLLFYQINDEYFYLIHKLGNDLYAWIEDGGRFLPKNKFREPFKN